MSIDDAAHIRRHQPTRLARFVGAALAFAVTLLVVCAAYGDVAPVVRRRNGRRLRAAGARA